MEQTNYKCKTDFILSNNTSSIQPTQTIPYKKSVYGNDTFCICSMYVFIDSVYKFRIFNKQFISHHFFKKLMYADRIRKELMYTENI